MLSQVVLEIARIIREDFLQQNAFTDYDYTCPLYKSLGMLKVMDCVLSCESQAVVVVDLDHARSPAAMPMRQTCVRGSSSRT